MAEKLIGRCLQTVRLDFDNVRITRIGDGENTDAEVFTTSGAQLDVVAIEWMHTNVGQHGVVFNFGFLQWWRVVRNDDQLGLSVTQNLKRLVVSERVLAGLHHKCQASVDVLGDRLAWLLQTSCALLDSGGLFVLCFLLAFGCGKNESNIVGNREGKENTQD